MIDYESEILSLVQDGLDAAGLSEVELFDRLILAPEVFPSVCVENIDNYTYRRTIDSGSNENHVIAAYEVNVYSNKTRGNREQCKEIFAAVSDVFTGMGFTRDSMNPIQMKEASVYRLVGRFTGVISKTGETYRR